MQYFQRPDGSLFCLEDSAQLSSYPVFPQNSTPLTKANFDSLVATSNMVPAATALRLAAQSKLDYVTGPRGTIIRCYAAGVPVPTAWTNWVQALRAIANGTDTTSITLPARPAFPGGT